MKRSRGELPYRYSELHLPPHVSSLDDFYIQHFVSFSISHDGVNNLHCLLLVSKIFLLATSLE